MEKEARPGIIYKYTSPSGKCYIGQTRHEYNRKNHHKNANGENRAFHSAIKKYGFDNFIYEVLYNNIKSSEVLNCLESFEIENNNSLFPGGYNLDSGGGIKIISNEARLRMSEAAKGRRKTEETKRKISEAHKGRKHTDEFKAKVSAANKGKVISESHRQAFIEANKKRIWSQESRDKIGRSSRGRVHSEESKRKMSEANKNRPVSDKTREKLRIAQTGKKASEETRQKLRDAHARRRNKKTDSPE